MICAIVALDESHIERINDILDPYISRNGGRIKTGYKSEDHPYITFVSFEGDPKELGDYINIDTQVMKSRYMIISLDKFSGFVDSKLHEWITNNA